MRYNPKQVVVHVVSHFRSVASWFRWLQKSYPQHYFNPWLHPISNIKNNFISDSYVMSKLILELPPFETVRSPKLGLCSLTLPCYFRPSSMNHHFLRNAAASISDIYIVEIIKYYLVVTRFQYSLKWDTSTKQLTYLIKLINPRKD